MAKLILLALAFQHHHWHHHDAGLESPARDGVPGQQRALT
jgi:hypothetical protein